MTANDLIAAFEALAESPDGVKRLRELVLQLAVRGKLTVSPDTSAKEGLPDGWKSCTLSEMGSWAIGSGFPIAFQGHVDRDVLFAKVSDMNREGNERWILSTANTVSMDDLKTLRAHAHPAGTVVFPKIGGAIATNKRRVLARLTAIDNNCLGIIPSPEVTSDWLFLVLSAIDLGAYSSGTSVPALSQGVIGTIPVLIPPLAEQHRIVARVDELMSLLDRLEAARAQRDELRRAARDAALAALRDAEDSEAVEAAWGRIAGHMDTLFAEPEDVAPLRQAVLQLAVRGRLVPQDPKDEPARVLLGSRGYLPNNPPWRLPNGWAWTTLAMLGEVLGGGTPSKSNPAYWAGDIPWVSPKDMKVPWLSDSQDHVSAAAVQESSTKLIPAGAVLMVVRGMILAHSFPVAVTMVDVTVNQDMKALIPYRSGLAPFLLLLIQGSRDRVLGLVEHSTHGTCKLPYASLSSLPIPIPPLAEQHRIVAKVDALMALCDTLEARLTAARDAQAAFAAAAVHHLDV